MMAQNFHVLGLEWDNKGRGYYANIEMGGFSGQYWIQTEAKLMYHPWATNPNMRFSALDSCDCGLEELPSLQVSGIDAGSKKRAGQIEKALLEFIATECIDK